MKKERYDDWIVLLVAWVAGITAIMDASGYLTNTLKSMDYFKFSIATLLLASMYFIMRLNKIIE